MKYYLYFFSLLLGSCCASKRPAAVQPSLIKRYHSIGGAVEMNDDKAVADVSFFVSSYSDNISKDSIITIFNLKGEGQAALIQAFKENNDKSHQQLTDLLNKQFQKSDDPGFIDIRHKKMTIVFSVFQKDFYAQIKKLLSAGDRLENIRISLTLENNNAKVVNFESWDKFVTQYGQFNIAGLTFSRATEVNVSPSLTIGGVTASAGSYDNKGTYQETDSLQKRYIVTTGYLDNSALTIEQSGTPQVDLKGNTSISLAVFFPFTSTTTYVSFDELVKENGQFQKPDKVKMNLLLVNIPQLQKDVTAKVKMDYTLRHIIKGDTTFNESDDDVIYYYGHTKDYRIESFIKKDDVVPPTINITSGGERLGLYDVVTKKYHEIIFNNLLQAESFLEWIANIVPHEPGQVKLGNYFLTVGFKAVRDPNEAIPYLTKQNLKELLVK